MQAQLGVGLDSRLRIDAPLFAITADLAANHILRLRRPDRLHHLGRFIAPRLAVTTHRWFHGDVRQELQKMILNHVANRPRLLEKRSAPAHTEVFGQGDLHAFDMIAIPKRFDEGIRAAKQHEIVHRTFAEIVVDAKDLAFAEGTQQQLIERLRRGKIAAERFLDDHARGSHILRGCQLGDDRAEEEGRNRQIKRRAAAQDRARLPMRRNVSGD